MTMVVEMSKNIKSSGHFVKHSCAQENIIESSKLYDHGKWIRS